VTGPDTIVLNANSQKIILKGQTITETVMGIPIKYKDTEILDIRIKKIDKDIPLDQEGRFDIVAKIEMDFDQEEITYNYYSVIDIVSGLGGISATVNLIIGVLGFAFLTHFIHDLAKMIQRKQLHKAKKF